MFAILDKKALFYGAPICFHNKAEALRAFTEEFKDPNSMVGKYPADFSMWLIAEYNPQTGIITPLPKPEFLEEAANLVEKKG
jgi:hypothetical protein